MAGDKKSSVETNFERLKKEMLQKRERAEKVNVSENVNSDTNVNTNNNVNKSVNKFVIRVENKEVRIRRQTYYLKEDTIQKIDVISEQSGIGKSELVQKILEDVLNNLEILKDGID